MTAMIGHPAIWAIVPVLLLGWASVALLQRIIRAGSDNDVGPADAIVVFGAAVWDIRPSISLQARLDAAAEACRQNRAPVVFCSGGRVRGISEASVMRKYLVDSGIPGDVIIPDDNGRNSRDTLFTAARFRNGSWKRVLLVSSPYHMHRICREARRHGLEPLACPAEPPVLSSNGAAVHLVKQYGRELVATTWYALRAWMAPVASWPFMRFISSLGRQVSWRARALLFEADAVADAIEFIGQQIKMAKPDIADTDAVTTPASGLQRPVEGTLSSSFGMRFRRLHSGIDVCAPYGTPVVAAAAGKVIICDDLGPYGNTIVLDHLGGLATVYAHLTGIILVQNASVRAGEVIGYIGTTGRSSGSHLHFEVRVHGSPVDPNVYLQARGPN